MSDPILSVVRIIDKNAQTLGTGFLVAANIIVTCSHVIQPVSRQREQSKIPDEVDIIFHATGQRQTAHVDHDRWLSWDKGDIALLSCDVESFIPTLPLSFISIDPYAELSVRTYGYTSTRAFSGINGIGTIIGSTKLSEHREVFQVSSEQITKGFSGAPIWLTATGEIIGIVTAITEPDSYGRLNETAFVTPINVLKVIYPGISIKASDLVGHIASIDRKSKVFVSYRRTNLTIVKDFLHKLDRELELIIDVDSLIFGKDWKLTVIDWMDEVDVCFLMITPEIFQGAQLAEAIAYEVESCMNSGVPIIPIILASVETNLLTKTLRYFGNERITYFSSEEDIRLGQLIRSVTALRRNSNLPPPIQKFLSSHLREVADFFVSDARRIWRMDQVPSAMLIDFGHKPDLSLIDDLVEVEMLGSNRRFIQLFFEQGRLLIVGEGGTGKTFLLHSLARELLRQLRGGEQDGVPLLLNLGNWKESVTLFSYLSTIFRRRSGESSDATFQELLESNKLILLLDGLDELLARGEHARHAQVHQFLNEYPSLSIVIATRSSEYIDKFRLYQIYLRGLGRPLIDQIIETYSFEALADKLKFIKILRHDKYLSNMIKRPFFLLLLLQVFAKNSDWFDNPSGLAKFFKWYVEALNEKFEMRESSKKVSIANNAPIKESFAMLAYWAFRTSTIQIDNNSTNWKLAGLDDIEKLLEFGRSTLLLIFDREKRNYSFPHIVLRNYLAASYSRSLNSEMNKNATRTLAKNPLNVQFFVFRDLFPEWNSWTYESHSYTISESPGTNDPEISLESVIFALFHSDSTQILDDARYLIGGISSEQVVFALLASTNLKFAQYLHSKMLNQVFFALLFVYLNGAKHYVAVAERLNSITGGNQEQKLALKKTRVFALEEAKRLASIIAEISGRLRFDSVAASMDEFIIAGNVTSLAKALDMLASYQKRDIEENLVDYSLVRDIAKIFRANKLSADLRTADVIKQSILAILDDLSIQNVSSVDTNMVDTLFSLTIDTVLAGEIGIFLLNYNSNLENLADIKYASLSAVVFTVVSSIVGFRKELGLSL